MKKVDRKRVSYSSERPIKDGPIVYWMSRDQRVDDNWALLFAKELAEENDREMVVVFFLVTTFIGATIRQYDFMIKGLMEVEERLNKLNIGFLLFLGDPKEKLDDLNKKLSPGAMILDFDSLEIKKKWKDFAEKKTKGAIFEVDTHNIVSCHQASPKQEFAAYTIRPKINKKLEDYLTEFPKIKKQKKKSVFVKGKTNWKKVFDSLKVDSSVAPVEWIKPGEKEAKKMLKKFIQERLDNYSEKRNDPNSNGQSDLSPYIHFGHISAQRIALEVKKSTKNNKSKEDFLEELIIRKELSDNFCYYNDNYDSFEGFPNWARESLNSKRKDQREYLYSKKEFEEGSTHDDLWNAAQLEMVKTGKMHGYMRMYWAKKILEWSVSPEEAMSTAIFLNDKYELDGRDSKGYTGIAWSIGGVHDRAWFNRPIFGKVRYMSYNGSKSKFDVQKYIDKFL